jgi:hypothetical protein
MLFGRTGKTILATLIASAIVSALPATAQTASSAPKHLPGELSADDVLNGVYPWPASPASEVHEETAGFDQARLGKTPAPGVHPRILISPDELPDLRARIKNTDTGRKMFARLQERLAEALKPGTYSAQLYDRLAAGDVPGATALLNEHKGLPGDIGHYQPWFNTVDLSAFDALVREDAAEGKRAATVTATWAKLVEPMIPLFDAQPMSDDIFRVRLPKDMPADSPYRWAAGAEFRILTQYQHLGYAYDFSFNAMTLAQRDTTRRVIAKLTAGRLWMGARLPHHFRNWNWIAIGLQQPLLSLSIEGEPGYDPRVYKLGVEIARDYITYGVSPTGSATEAVGYSNFGLVWASPFYVAAARRGEDFLTQSHNRRLIDWYLASEEPWGGQWESHGDGGDGGPSFWNMAMWKYFYPNDPKVDYLWQTVLYPSGKDDFSKGTYHLIEPLLWVSDPAMDHGKLHNYASGKDLAASLTFFDPLRSSVNARTDWTPNATAIEFECRTDSVGPSHEHADRGNFTLSAMGREWAKESFRSIESRHHNVILIDGMGQGYWPGPGRWLGEQDGGWALMAAADAKPAYDTWWPKEVNTEAPDWVRYQYPRWASFLDQEKVFKKNYGDVPATPDPRPSVLQHWTDFKKTDPRMWDEDTQPVALPHNPVQRAFRTITFVREKTPYLLVTDDIQKDSNERLYEWNMMTGPNTDVVSIDGNDLLLSDATEPRNAEGLVKPKKGDRELLVRVLDLSPAAHPHDYQARPSFRLEVIEKKDTNDGDGVGYGMGRSFGMDRRLTVATRSVAPNFKILLLPMHAGDPLPKTTWNADKTVLTIDNAGTVDTYTFHLDATGRNRIVANRPGQKPVTLP